MNFPIYFWFEVMAFITCLINYRKINKSLLFYFVPYLFIIVIYEYGTLNSWFTIKNSNVLSVNVIITFEFLFYSFLLIKTVGSEKKKWIFKGVFIFTILFLLLNAVFIQGLTRLHTYSLLLCNSFIIILSVNFFYELLNDKMELDSIFTYPLFWITTGILFFTLGQFSFFCFYEYMIRTGNTQSRFLFNTISNFSNAILYSCIIIAVVCQSRKTTI